jgi:hypothetical protein
MTVLEVLDHVSLMNSGDCDKACRTFLKNTQNQAACRTVDKSVGYGFFWYSGQLYNCWQWSNMDLWWSDN